MERLFPTALCQQAILTGHSGDSALPTVTAYIYHDAARYTTYYCHVHSNGNKVATGKLTLTIQGRKHFM